MGGNRRLALRRSKATRSPPAMVLGFGRHLPISAQPTITSTPTFPSPCRWAKVDMPAHRRPWLTQSKSFAPKSLNYGYSPGRWSHGRHRVRTSASSVIDTAAAQHRPLRHRSPRPCTHSHRACRSARRAQRHLSVAIGGDEPSRRVADGCGLRGLGRHLRSQRAVAWQGHRGSLRSRRADRDAHSRRPLRRLQSDIHFTDIAAIGMAVACEADNNPTEHAELRLKNGRRFLLPRAPRRAIFSPSVRLWACAVLDEVPFDVKIDARPIVSGPAGKPSAHL